MEEEKRPTIKFKIDQPVSGKFVFDSSLTGEGTGKDGEKYTWNLYKFEDANGQEEVFFASKGLHAKLEEKGNLKDKTFTITKVLMKDEDGNTAENDKGQPILEFDVKFGPVGSEGEEISGEEAGFPTDLSDM